MRTTKENRTWRRILAATVLCSLLLSLVGAAPVAAAERDDGVPDGVEPAATNIAVTAAEREVGTYWQNYYDSPEGDLPNAQGNVQGFYNYLRTHPWGFLGKARWCQAAGNDCFTWSNSLVWEDDWIDNDNSWVDNVDLVFYEGHGWPGGFTVRAPDDGYVEYWEANNRWGNNDLEYMFLLSCSVLANSHEADWANTMNGLHLLGGFANTAYDVAGFGNAFAFNIVWGYNYKDSWFAACDSHQPSGVTAKVLAEEYANFFETAYSTNADPVPDSTYWWWTKACGAPTTSTLTPSQLGDQFPILETPPLALDEANRTFDQLDDAFGFGQEVGAAAAYVDVDGTRVISDTEGRVLQMDLDTGQYYYFDPTRTFSPTLPVGAAQVFTEDDAKRVADAFLAQNGLLPADARFNTVTQVAAQEIQGVAAADSRVLQEVLASYEVIYSRYVSATVPTVDAASGQVVNEVVEIPVDGPGAKVKVYVSPGGGEASAASATQAGSVVGGQGGWRRVTETSASAPRATVEILPYDPVIKALFAQLEPQVAYGNVPFANPIQKEILSFNLSAYEEPGNGGQDVLYPAYRLLARYEGEAGSGAPGAAAPIADTVVFTDYSWIPANAEFMSPLAKIESSSSTAAPLAPGAVFTATAVDASQPLNQLGYDASLTFALGVGPYTYKWYLNSIDPANEIGNGRNLSYTIPLPGDPKAGAASYQLILQVTDVGSNHTSLNTSTASVTVQSAGPLYLPAVLNGQ